MLLTLQHDALHVALLRRSHAPFKDAVALPGGYVHVDTDADARTAAERVLSTKTGVQAPYLEQLATFSGAQRDPRGWSVSIAYYALVAGEVATTGRPGALQHFAVDQLPTLPFDHRQIIDTAVARLRSKSQYSSLPCYLAGAQFTLPQLQRIYETLMGEELNKVSFRRKMEEMGMLEAVPGEFRGGAFRPAQLYRLKSDFAAHPSLLERGL